MFSYEMSKTLRTPIFKNICERLVLFVSPENTINSGGDLGLDETSTECMESKYSFKRNNFIQSNAAI